MANWVLSLAYASVCIRLFRHPLHRKVPIFVAALGASSLYMTIFDHAINWPIASIPMTIIRALAVVESATLVFRDQNRSRILSLHCALQALYTLIQFLTLQAYPLLTLHPIHIGYHWVYPLWEGGFWVYAIGCCCIMAEYHRVLTCQSEEAAGAAAHPPASDRPAALPVTPEPLP